MNAEPVEAPPVDYFDGRLPAAVSQQLQLRAAEAAEKAEDPHMRDLLQDLAQGRVSAADFIADERVDSAADKGLQEFRERVSAMTPQERRDLETRGVAQARRLGLLTDSENVEPGFLDGGAQAPDSTGDERL